MSADELEKFKKKVQAQEQEIAALKDEVKKEKDKLSSEIKKTKEYYESIIALMPGHVYWLDKNNVYMGCNDLQAKSAELKSRQEIVGKTNFDLPWKEQAEKLNRINTRVIKTGQPQVEEEFAVMAEGPGVYYSQKVPLRDNQNNIIGVLGISLDITKQKKLETALISAKEKAEAANQAKTEFIANMSHDLRTPLSGVVGMSELLEAKAKDAEQAQYAKWIHDCSNQLLDLLNGVLDIISLGNVKEDKLQITTFDLKQCIEELAYLEMPTIKLKGLNLKVNIDDKVPRFIKTDRLKLHRIMLNLLGNAIKFTQTGHVSIEVKLVKQQKDKATVYFAVSDTGIGIPKEQQDKIFDRFHRVNPSYQGTYEGHGVGLHIAQFYVKLLGGEIQLKSEPGKGTTFYYELSFKISKEDAQDALSDVNENKALKSPKTQQTQIKPTSQKNEYTEGTSKVLVIEDNLIARHTIEQLLKNAGCWVATAPDGETGVSLAKKHDLDLIISDIGLPDISGYDVTKQIRDWEKNNHLNPTPIIGLTAHAKKDVKQECEESGMDDIFCKPLDKSILQMILSKWLKPAQKKQETNATQSIKKNEKPYQSPGHDLPDSEDELFNLNQYPLFDVEYAISVLGSEQMVREILPLLMEEEAQKDIQAIKAAHQNKNWEQVAKLAHKIKGGAVNCGAIRMKYACQYLERYHKTDHQKLLTSLYQQLIYVTEDTQNHIKAWLKE